MLCRVRVILKRREEEAEPCPDVCIVLPPGFGFRPGDRFTARGVNGELRLKNRRELSTKEQRQLDGCELSCKVESADWSVQLLPCPFCGSRARLLPDSSVEELGTSRNYEVCCTGCSVRTPPLAFQRVEEAVAAWNWRVSIPAAVTAKSRKPRARTNRRGVAKPTVDVRELTPTYARKEYGVTARQLKAAEDRVAVEIAAEREAGLLHPWPADRREKARRTVPRRGRAARPARGGR